MRFQFIFAEINGGFQYALTSKQLWLFVPLTICTTIGPVLLFKSFQLLDASENTILQSSQNLWGVMGASIFLKEAFSINKIAGALVIILGIGIAFWKRNKVQLNFGVVLALVAAVFYAAADLISYYLVRDFDPMSLVVYVCFLPVITLLIVRPKTVKKVRFYFKPQYALIIILLGLSDTVGTVLTYYAYQIGRNAAQITPLMGTITIVSVLMAVVLLKERDNLVKKMIGAVVVVLGVLLVL